MTQVIHISPKGILIIKKFEGLHDGDLHQIGLQPKMCPAGVWTIGYGHALLNKNTGEWLRGEADYHLIAEQYPQYLKLTELQATEILEDDLAEFEKKVLQRLKITVTQNQFDALVSHTFNTGGSNGLFELINKKASKEAIRKWWTTKYITGDGKILPGLIKRRREECDLYFT